MFFVKKGDLNDEEEKEESPTILTHSCLASTEKQRRRLRKQAKKRLRKSMSCKTLGELELEEVKGSVDLGFVFKKENICSRMMSVVPGLQRWQRKQAKHDGRGRVEE